VVEEAEAAEEVEAVEAEEAVRICSCPVFVYLLRPPLTISNICVLTAYFQDRHNAISISVDGLGGNTHVLHVFFWFFCGFI
jgi:hypothetical protein